MGFAGIDLGNSRFKVAVADTQGNPVMLSNEVGELFTPSVVYFDDDRVIVGTEAANAGLADRSRFVENWKRHMGTDTVLYEAPDGKQYLAKDIAQILLANAAENYEQRCGEPLSEAAISVPANYNDRQKAETIEAAEAARIKVIVTPHEPTAAAFGNKVHRRGDGFVALLDLGGGTFDVSIVQVSGNSVEVVATNGEPKLGGQDFNQRLVEMILKRFEAEHGFRPTPETHPLVFQELYPRVEQLKLTLSVRDHSSVTVACDGQVLTSEVTRAEFKNATKDLVDKAMVRAERTFKEASISYDDVRETIPVGGGSLMPHFLKAIEERFGKTLSYHAEPYYAVALGSVVVGRLTIEREGGEFKVGGHKLPPLSYRLRDVTAHPFGVAALNDERQLVNAVILQKGKPIPSDHTEAFVLAEQDQTEALIRVLQGEHGVPAEQCQELGSLEMKDLKPIHDRPHRIDIRLRIDRNGMLTAEAHDPISGKSEEMVVDYKKKYKKAG